MAPGASDWYLGLPEMRFATIAIVGRANVGKSTFLNAALSEPLAIVSVRPQTTRDALLGIVHRPDAQLAFLDTPGLHHARNELGRRMNAAALDAARLADVLLFMTDIDPAGSRKKALELAPEDREILERLPERTPTVAAVNKLDLCRDKNRILPLLTELEKTRSFAAIVPVSLRDPRDPPRLLDALVAVAPEGDPGHPDDALTDRPTSFFAREYVRESVLHATRAEVPHAVAVAVDEFIETPTLVSIRATLHVEKPGQRKILVGTGGTTIRDVGIAARKRIEELVGRKVHLELFVRVTPRWRDTRRMLAELGHEPETRRYAEAQASGLNQKRAKRAAEAGTEGAPRPTARASDRTKGKRTR
jgi:GTPase